MLLLSSVIDSNIPVRSVLVYFISLLIIRVVGINNSRFVSVYIMLGGFYRVLSEPVSNAANILYTSLVA